MPTYDWNELLANAGAEFQALPSGEYDVQITSAEASNTSNGKLMFKCRMQVTGGPNAGKVIWNNFTISPESPQALSIFFRHMRALGLDDSFFKSQPSPETIAEALRGRACHITLGQKQWQGETRNQVERIGPAAGGLAAAGMPMPGMGVPNVPAPQPQAPPPPPVNYPAPQPAATPAAAPPPPVALPVAPVSPPQPPMATTPPEPAPVPPMATQAPTITPPEAIPVTDPATGMIWNGTEWINPPQASPPPPPAPNAPVPSAPALPF